MTTDYLTPDDVASRLQVSRQVVYNWINDGRLRAVKAGRTLRIPHYALDAFLQPVHAGDISTGSVEPEPGLSFDRFTPAAQAIASAAGNEVHARQHIEIEVEHILWALVKEGDGIAPLVLKQLGVNPDRLTQQLDQALTNLPSDPGFKHSPHMLAISARVRMILQRAEELASLRPDLQIDTSHIFLAICEEAGGVSAQILHSFGVTPDQLRIVLIDVRAAHPVEAPQTVPQHSTDWEQRIEQQLNRIETELAAVRSLLTRPNGSDAA